MATGVIRQRRETRIGPVGVVRTNSGTDTLGNAIKNAADQLSNRYYKIAAAKAKKTGQLQAAEVNLERITTLDENTLMPQALKVADQMGNIQREAFENAILLRFEGALADDISAKKAELMARVAPNRNAPQQFEQLFSEYLTATGENASGYYKQIITDLGASALDDGRSKLKVAQIQRIQAEAAEAKRRQDEEYVKSAYAQGLAGVAFQHTRNKTVVKNNAETHKGVQITDDANESALHKRANAAYIRGRIVTMMQDPKVGMDARLIQQYFSSGGQQYLYDLLSPASKTLVKEIENISDADEPIEYLEIAAENEAAFTNATNSYTFVQAAEEAEQQRIAAELTSGADFFIRETQGDIDSDTFSSIGHSASPAEIGLQIDFLDSKATKTNDFRVDRSIKKEAYKIAEAAKDQIAEGIIVRVLETNPEIANELSLALNGKGMGYLQANIPSELFDQFVRVYDGQNKGKLSEIANAWSQGNKIAYDANKSEQVILLKNTQRFIEETKGSGSSADLIALRDQIVRNQNAGEFNLIEGQLTDLLTSIDSDIREAQAGENAATYDTFTREVVRSVTPENIDSKLNDLSTQTQQLNGDPDKAFQTAQSMVNVASVALIEEFISQLGFTEDAANQTKLMAAYANNRSNVPEGLDPKAKEAVDTILDRIDRTYFAEGDNTFSPQPEFVSGKLAESANRISEAINSNNARVRENTFVNNVLTKGSIANAGDADVQRKVQSVIANHVGLPELPANLYELGIDELTPELAAALDLSKGGGAVTRALVESADKLIVGAMDPEAIDAFMRNIREIVLTDSSGRISVSSSARVALGKDRANKLRVLYHAYNLAPRGSEGAFVNRVSERIDDALSTDEFKELTGYANAVNLMTRADVPANLIDEFEPIVGALAIMHKKNTFQLLEQFVDERYTENKNGYSPFTGTSMVEFDVKDIHRSVRGVDAGIQRKVQKLSSADAPLYYDVGSRVSVDDIRKGVSGESGFVVTAPSVGEAMGELRVRSRVVYGPTPQYTPDFPLVQLYKVDQFGMVTVIDGSAFNLMTDEDILAGIREFPASTIRVDPTAQTMEELGGDVEAFVGQFGIGVGVSGGGANPTSNPLRITVDGTN